jgi:hypothetical protein
MTSTTADYNFTSPQPTLKHVTFTLTDGSKVERTVRDNTAHVTLVRDNGDGTYSGACRTCDTHGEARPYRIEAHDDADLHLIKRLTSATQSNY